MNGPHLGDELSALLDGELDEAEQAEAMAHLRGCAFCTSELAAFERTRSLVRSLPMVDPPNALRPRQELRQPSAWIAAAAAVLVLVLLQAVPADQSVALDVAGLVQTHSSRSALVDPTGRVVRASQLTAGPSAAKSPTKLIPTPDRLGDYQLVGVYRRGDVVHELFTDGQHTLSVFAEPGDVDNNKRGHHEWQGADVLVWESGGVVYTAVGDDADEAAASMPKSGRLGVAERLRRGCRALAEAV